MPPDVITWTALLGHWTKFAQASLALPNDADGARWRDSVAPAITLQAITCALREIDRLDAEDRPYAIDRAEVQVRDAAAALHATWGADAVPVDLIAMHDDARDALIDAPYRGARELVWEGPGVYVVPDVSVDGDDGSLAVMQPGTLVAPGTPVAWWIGRDVEWLRTELDALRERACGDVPHQVYRELDDDGRIVRDIVVPVTADPRPGLPLLVPICHGGTRIGAFTMDAADWEAMQRAALADRCEAWRAECEDVVE